MRGDLMVDPLTLSTLGGAALTEGIRFLYNQAAELIEAARERRDKAKDAERVEVGRVPGEVLNGPLPDTVDARVLSQTHFSLARLLNDLAPYVKGGAEIAPDDPQLLGVADRLRTVLEAVYGQRLTLTGEQREPTGTQVNVQQVLGEIEGDASALRAGTVGRGARVDVDQSATTVRPGGSVVGAQIDRIGGEADRA
jgi:hypothetical protein